MPFLPVLRYTPSGMQKRAAWEECWALQRREDAGEKVGEIPVPPKYASADFKKGTYWRLRGKLDVPKERFILYPHAERDADPTPVLGWAGWDALQQAQALAAYFIDMKESEGWRADRLTPLLAGLLELLPWLRQWHNDVDPGDEPPHGRLLRPVPGRGGPRPRPHAGRPPPLVAPRRESATSFKAPLMRPACWSAPAPEWERRKALLSKAIRCRLVEFSRAIDIDLLRDHHPDVLVGAIDSRTALRLIRDWATLHRGELEENWRLTRMRQPLRQIAPLE